MARRNRRLLVIATGILIIGSTAAGSFWWRQGIRQGTLERGRAAYAHEDWPAAERAAREKLKGDRGDNDALALLARSLYRQERDDSASAIFDRLTN